MKKFSMSVAPPSALKFGTKLVPNVFPEDKILITICRQSTIICSDLAYGIDNYNTHYQLEHTQGLCFGLGITEELE